MTCNRVPIVTSFPQIRLPGGPILSALPQTAEPDETAATKSLLGQAMTAMAPLVPLFRIMDTILALKDFAAAVPEAVTTFDPSGLVDALGRVSSTADALAQFVPALSVPLLMRDILTVLVRYLSSIETDLDSIQVQITAAAAAELGADTVESESPGTAAALRNTAACTAACVAVAAEDRLAAVTAAMGPMASLLQLVGILAGIAGLPVPPGFDLDGSSVESVLAGVTSAREALETFLESVGG
jgi:hypothetical protein